MRYKLLHFLSLYSALALFSVMTFAHAAIDDEAMVKTALQQALELQLAQHETWLALLHYKSETVLQRFISQADDERFFLSETGQTDAAAELEADIKGFFEKQKPGHAQCLFPARWFWLKQQLNLSDDFDVSCPQLDAFMKRVSHHKLFMVFPSMYLNNPGSTFGHTFLRFDNHDGSILLSQTLNYSARVDKSDNVVSYISKGLFGGYRGFFRARPYFETVQEYSNIENRDIWEYRLDFTEQEIQQLVRHVWEVKGIDFDYYFFRENCAYRLLALLDVIRPGMGLTGENRFPVYAIPVDTVRALDDVGLIQSRKFRASLVTQIDGYFSHADNYSAVVLNIISENTLADRRVITGQLSVIGTLEKKRDVLKQSYTILQFKGESDSAKAQLILQLISELPDLPAVTENIAATGKTISPEKGHDSIRITAGYGRQNSRQFIDLRFRPAFHDLLDAPQGYVDGAAINVFDVRFKWFANNDSSNNPSNNLSNNFRLESLSLFNVTSLSPVRQWRKSLSWMLDFRFDRAQLSESQSARNFISRGGAGFSFKQQTWLPFVLLMAEWNLSSDYQKGYSILLGLQAGLRFTFNSNQLLLSYQADEAVTGFNMDRQISQFQWQYNLQVNHALRALYKRTLYDFYNDEDWSLSYYYYF